MDAVKTFNNLLRLIENSNLNYKLTKTTFSATISLKSSFVKKFSENVRLENEELKNVDLDLKNTDEVNLTMKAKIQELEASAKNNSDKHEEKMLKLHLAYDNSKVKSELLEKQLGEFREELLKIKSDKNEVRKSLKAEKEKGEAVSMEQTVVHKKCLNLQEELKSKLELLQVKDFELNSKNEENDDLRMDLSKAQNELEQLKALNVSKAEYTCDDCDTSVLNYIELKVHTRRYQTHCKSSQYEKDYNFETYPCFYCDKPITSPNDIETHEISCLEVSHVMSVTFQQPNVFPCDECGLTCISMDELLRHMKTCHLEEQDKKMLFEDPSDAEESKLILKEKCDLFQCGDCGADCEDQNNLDGHIAEYHELGEFYCEICPLQFSTNGNLYLHELSCHENEF